AAGVQLGPRGAAGARQERRVRPVVLGRHADALLRAARGARGAGRLGRRLDLRARAVRRG
ncbi:unnamed protein product, partial [Prorocentrum cordatum]